ncbi:MAG: hypothetical protein LBS42_06675 [Tannerella sp.]|jgi:hypothetical protein|nr:hypothetical protein [Tannerella sp.]
MKTNDMKRNGSHGAGIRRMAWLAAGLLLWPAAIFAQAKTNHGVDMSATTGLFAPYNFIYFGHYKHATALEYKEGSYNVTAYENDSTPIVWRIMGEEAGDGRITLLSDYVLDSRIYGNSAQTWGNSDILNWLNGSASGNFPESFTSVELGNVHTNPDIYAPVYDYSNGNYLPLASDTSSNTRFYIPWGTPNQGTFTHKNKVLWTIGNNSNPFPNLADTISSAVRVAVLKGANPAELGFTDYNVYYWLRPEIMSGQMLVVKSDGDNNFEPVGVKMGVRPMFKLDTADILFAAELMEHNYIDRVDQLEADNNGIYTDEDALPNGGSGGIRKAFKLTLLASGGPTIGDSLAYDLDEYASTITDTVAVNPGERLGFEVTGVANADRLAYKIVGGSGQLNHYGDTVYVSPFTFDSIHIVADNIYTEKLPNGSDNNYYDHLNSGSVHTTYVWAQQNYPTRSNEGSDPISFTLKVLADTRPPALTSIVAKRYADNSAKVFFNIDEINLKGKLYYVVDPGTPPTAFDDLFAMPLSSRQYFTNVATVSPDSIVLLTFGENTTVHDIYIVAKDQVRNTSQVYHVSIPLYVPDYPPVGKPNLEAILEINETVTFNADDIATDDNLPSDILKISDIITLSDNTIATVVLDVPTPGILSIRGVASGATSVEVEVTDITGLRDTVPIAIKVRESVPQISIDYVEEWLEGFVDGVEYIFNGGDPEAPGTVLDSIPDNWFGTTVSIVKVSAVGAAYNSVAQSLYIPPRPAPPAAKGIKESIIDFRDGQIIGVNDSMEYKVDTLDVWTSLIPGSLSVSDLSPGDYNVRYKAIPSKSFAGEPDTLTIAGGTVLSLFPRAIYLPDVPGVTVSPAPGVHYAPATGDFGFSLKSDAPVVVTTNRMFDGVREELTGTPNADGGYDYLIINVSGSTPVVVYIHPGHSASEEMEKQSVWTYGGQIYVETQRSKTVSVYALNGRLIKQVRVSEGLTAIPVRDGIYVVLMNDGARRKVVVK